MSILIAAARFTALLTKSEITLRLSGHGLKTSHKSAVVSAELGRCGKEALGVPRVHSVLENSFLKIFRVLIL